MTLQNVTQNKMYMTMCTENTWMRTGRTVPWLLGLACKEEQNDKVAIRSAAHASHYARPLLPACMQSITALCTERARTEVQPMDQRVKPRNFDLCLSTQSRAPSLLEFSLLTELPLITELRRPHTTPTVLCTNYCKRVIVLSVLSW